MQLNSTLRFRACRSSANPEREVEAIFPDCRVAGCEGKKLMEKTKLLVGIGWVWKGMPLGNGAQILMDGSAQESLGDMFKSQVKRAVRNARRAGSIRAGWQRARQLERQFEEASR